MDTAATTEPGTADERDSSGRTGLAIGALGLAALVAVMDGTVVAAALGSLATAFSTTLATVVWLTVAYLLAVATALPTLAWASARFGGRAVFLFGLSLFLLGSALCALAPSVGWLIAFRFVQGIGGGLLEPSSLALAAGLANPRTMGRVMGTMSAVINVAPVLGPLVGAALATSGHWRVIFLINLPLGLVVLAAALAFVPRDHPHRDGRRPAQTQTVQADARGLVLLTVGYLGVLFALNRVGDGVSSLVLVSALAGLTLLAGYVRHALTSPAPALDLTLLRHKGFASSLAVMGLVGFVMYGQMAALPLVGEAQHQLHGAAQGLLVCALGAGLLVSMSTSGRLSDLFGPRPLVHGGSLVTAGGFTVMAAFHTALPLTATLGLFVFIGLGFGATAAPTFASVYRLLPPPQQPTGTVALFMTLQLTASLAVTVLGVLTRSSAWITLLFVLFAAAALAINALSGRLPGRPD